MNGYLTVACGSINLVTWALGVGTNTRSGYSVAEDPKHSVTLLAVLDASRPTLGVHYSSLPSHGSPPDEADFSVFLCSQTVSGQHQCARARSYCFSFPNNQGQLLEAYEGYDLCPDVRIAPSAQRVQAVRKHLRSRRKGSERSTDEHLQYVTAKQVFSKYRINVK